MAAPDADSSPHSDGARTDADPLAETEGGLGELPVRADDPLVRANVAARLFGTPAQAPTIGRYAVLKVLGEGGMGTVYACYDDQLDRRIALKLVRGGQTDAARKRMLREAQAMAKLSHPNVVNVFEVGEHEGQLFVAMEYVKGPTLGRWRDDEDLMWRDVVAKYLEAGRGLAAAHGEGLVHRDFKPHNAIVGLDGRVRVLDFGLAARHGEQQRAVTQSTIMPKVKDAALDTPLTATGTVMGTPAYMPPEQFMGEAVDARSDQFSFCVALWEALYGARPFAGKTPAELFTKVAQGNVAEPERSDAPAGLRQLLLRGLSAKPRDRWPDMPSLLHALERSVAPRSAWWLRLAGLAVAIGGLVGGYALSGDDREVEVARRERQRAQNESTVAKAQTHVAKRAEARADLAMRNALRIARAAVLEDAPTEAAAFLREVHASDPDTVYAWRETAPRARDRARPLRAIYEGHGGPLHWVAFSSGGERIVTASADGTARVWSVPDPSAPPLILRGHRGPVRDAQFAADDARIVTAGEDGTARLYDLESPEDPVVLDPGTGPLWRARISPDGERVVTAGEDGTTRLWPADGSGPPGGEVVAEHAGAVRRASFSAQGRFLASGGGDGTIRLVTLDGSRADATLQGHRGRVTDLAFAPDGEHVASASSDHELRVWSTAAPTEPPVVLEGHSSVVRSVRFSPDGTRLVSGADDKSVGVFTADASAPSFALGKQAAEVRFAEFSPDGARVVTAGADHSARVYTVDGSRPPLVLTGHTAGLRAARFSPDGSLVVTASYDDTARLYAVESEAPPVTVLPHAGAVRTAAFSHDATRLVTAAGDAKARVWAADGGAEPLVLVGHREAVTSAVFTPDDTRIVTASRDGSVKVWDASRGEVLATFAEHEAAVYSAEVDRQGRRIVSASVDETVRIRSLDGTGPVVVLRDHGATVRGAAFSPDGDFVASASVDGRIRVFSADGSGDPTILAARSAAFWGVAYSHDGEQIAAGSSDGTVSVFSADGSGDPVVFFDHTGPVNMVAFSPDDTRVITAALDRTVRVFPADGGGPVIVLNHHDNEVYGATFSPDADRIATAGADRTAQIHETEHLFADLRALYWRTPFCHAPLRRARLLAETPEVARAHYDRCMSLTRLCARESWSACQARVAETFGQAG